MRQISFWAKDHVWSTRLLIVLVIYPLLNLCGWFLGAAFFWEGSELPYFLYFFSLGAFFLVFIQYAGSNNKKLAYWRRKTFDLLLVVTTFWLIVFTGNHWSSSSAQAPVNTSFASSPSPVSTILPTNKSKKQKVKFFKRLVKKLESHYKAASAPRKTLYIVLTVLVACLLIFLLSALACNIACAGSEGAAYVILFIGLAAIIFGVVRIIQRINRGPRKKPEQNPVRN